MSIKLENFQTITFLDVSRCIQAFELDENHLNSSSIFICSQDDIEKVIAEIEREERRRERVVEAVVDPPSRRVNFSLCPHPFKDELIMFGGEFHDGRKVQE